MLQYGSELLRRVIRFHLRDGLVGKFVAAFVFGVAGVALDPVPLDFVMHRGGV